MLKASEKFCMKLTMHQKYLIIGFRLFDLTEEQKGILLLLETEKDWVAMIDYLLENRKAARQDILSKLAEILNKKKFRTI